MQGSRPQFWAIEVIRMNRLDEASRFGALRMP